MRTKSTFGDTMADTILRFAGWLRYACRSTEWAGLQLGKHLMLTLPVLTAHLNPPTLTFRETLEARQVRGGWGGVD